MSDWWRTYHDADLPIRATAQVRFWATVAEVAQQRAKQSQDDCFFDAAGMQLRDAERAWSQIIELAQRRKQRIADAGLGALLE